MNYTEASTIENNSWVRDRVKISLSNYINYLLNTGTEDPMYNEKQAAASRLAQQSASVISTLMFTLSGDAEMQAAGPAIPDATLQALVEKTIAKFYPIQAVPAMGGQMMPTYYPPPVKPQ